MRMAVRPCAEWLQEKVIKKPAAGRTVLNSSDQQRAHSVDDYASAKTKPKGNPDASGIFRAISCAAAWTISSTTGW